jgi:hypothetical protein
LASSASAAAACRALFFCTLILSFFSNFLLSFSFFVFFFLAFFVLFSGHLWW